MSFADVDARIVTAGCLWVIGSIVIWFSVKIWWTDPLARPFLFKSYLTARGAGTLVRALPALFLLGATALAGALGRFAYWFRNRGAMNDDLVAGAGILEAAVSLWATGALIIFVIRTWRQWQKTP